jgi:hypothetical protein
MRRPLRGPGASRIYCGGGSDPAGHHHAESDPRLGGRRRSRHEPVPGDRRALKRQARPTRAARVILKMAWSLPCCGGRPTFALSVDSLEVVNGQGRCRAAARPGASRSQPCPAGDRSGRESAVAETRRCLVAASGGRRQAACGAQTSFIAAGHIRRLISRIAQGWCRRSIATSHDGSPSSRSPEAGSLFFGRRKSMGRCALFDAVAVRYRIGHRHPVG